MFDDATYDEFAALLREACAAALRALPVAAGGEEVCAIALYSDASAMSIDMAANTFRHLAATQIEDPDDALYVKWSPAEWALEGFATRKFDQPGALLRQLAAIDKSSAAFERHRDRIFGTAVDTLDVLRRSGALGRGIVVFAVSDYADPDREISWINRLNDQDDATEFRRWIESRTDAC